MQVCMAATWLQLFPKKKKEWPNQLKHFKNRSKNVASGKMQDLVIKTFAANRASEETMNYPVGLNKTNRN